MALNAKNAKGGSFTPVDPIDAGTYPARLVQVIDLGLQKQTPYQGKDKEPACEINLTYELVDEFMTDDEGNELKDKPRHVSERMPLRNLKSENAKSTARYNALDPDGDYEGDFSQLVGTPCMVTIVQNKKGERVYSNVGSISSMRAKEAKKCPELVNPPKVLDLDDPDVEVFLSLPEFIQNRVKEGLEFEGSKLHKMLEDHKGSNSKGKEPVEDDEEPEEEDLEEDSDNEDW